MDKYVQAELAKQSRYVREDPAQEQGYLFRGDQLSFIKSGVPCLFLFRGTDYLNGGTAYEKTVKEKYYVYHTPSDEYNSGWRFDGTLDDMAVLYNVGKKLATSNVRPKMLAHL
jgi:Zn-dependent M28 family amino/carboxypeptidase